MTTPYEWMKPDTCAQDGGHVTNPFDEVNGRVLANRRASDYEVRERVERLNDQIVEHQHAIRWHEQQIELLSMQRERIKFQANLPGENEG